MFSTGTHLVSNEASNFPDFSPNQFLFFPDGITDILGPFSFLAADKWQILFSRTLKCTSQLCKSKIYCFKSFGAPIFYLLIFQQKKKKSAFPVTKKWANKPATAKVKIMKFLTFPWLSWYLNFLDHPWLFTDLAFFSHFPDFSRLLATLLVRMQSIWLSRCWGSHGPNCKLLFENKNLKLPLQSVKIILISRF